jgi:hypothetical protein
MALKANVFDSPTRDFLDTLTDLEFLGRAVEMQLRNAESIGQSVIKERRRNHTGDLRIDETGIGIRSRLLIPDIFEKDPTFARVTYGGESKHDEEFLAMIREINYRSQAQTLCMVYEALEKFVKRIGSLLFYQKRTEWTLERRADFHEKKRDWAKQGSRNTAEYFEAYVSFVANNNCDPLLSEILGHYPRLQTAMSANKAFDLTEVLRILSCIRHSTVHSNGEVSDRTTRKLQKADRAFIKSITMKSTITSRETILPPVGAAAIIFDGISALGLALYRVISDDCKMLTSL